MTSPVPTSQAPSFYRHRIGDAVVTAVSDGFMPNNPATLQNIEPAESLAILQHAGRPAPWRTAVNVFVVQTPAQTVLIDTGGGQVMGPTAGHMMANLAAAGITPDSIDVVLMTHLHRDHVAGLLTPDGAPAFANATLVIPQAEAVFWMDGAAAAAEDRRPTVELVKRMVTPYGKQMVLFTEREPLPGIEAVPLPGHTPGHMGYAIGTGVDRLLIWGDIFHSPDIQCRRPEAAVAFDIDQPLAIATRRAILAQAADEQVLVAGMHTQFPAFIRIVRDGDAYAVRPIVWSPAL